MAKAKAKKEAIYQKRLIVSVPHVCTFLSKVAGVKSQKEKNRLHKLYAEVLISRKAPDFQIIKSKPNRAFAMACWAKLKPLFRKDERTGRIVPIHSSECKIKKLPMATYLNKYVSINKDTLKHCLNHARSGNLLGALWCMHLRAQVDGRARLKNDALARLLGLSSASSGKRAKQKLTKLGLLDRVIVKSNMAYKATSKHGSLYLVVRDTAGKGERYSPYLAKRKLELKDKYALKGLLIRDNAKYLIGINSQSEPLIYKHNLTQFRSDPVPRKMRDRGRDSPPIRASQPANRGRMRGYRPPHDSEAMSQARKHPIFNNYRMKEGGKSMIYVSTRSP